MKTTKKPINWSAIGRGFIKSNYITALWNWFMGLAGKAAEPVLFASVLYSGYQLVPGVPQPSVGINAIAFITQQAALDVGGMGLIKLTKDEDPEQFKFARYVGYALITLMVVNMVVATAGRVFSIPTSAMQFVEGILLIVRSIFAVLFGHAIHTLKDNSVEDLDHDIDQIVSEAVLSEVEQIRESYEIQIEEFKQQIEEIKSHQTLSLASPESFEQSKTTDSLQSFAEIDSSTEMVKSPRITRKLDPRELKTFEGKPSQKRSAANKKSESKLPNLPKYLYTKKEVARLAKCSEFEVEKAVRDGALQLQKNGDKILKSSVVDFIVIRKKETA